MQTKELIAALKRISRHTRYAQSTLGRYISNNADLYPRLIKRAEADRKLARKVRRFADKHGVDLEGE